ncbi:MAG: FlgO family outer membrane protein [Thermodesulfobacteriota bacterium]
MTPQGSRIGSGLALAALLLWLGGCLFGPDQRLGGTVSVASPDFFGIGEDLAGQLAGSLGSQGQGCRLVLTTFVDIDDLYVSSRFGRALTESVATRLFHRGFKVVEVRKSSELLVKDRTGELTLTRDTALLAESHQASAILAGTYALTPGSVIVNARLLDAGSQDVLAVAGMEIQRSEAINALLASARGLAGGELSAYE